MAKYYKGPYRPINPAKYSGNVNNIIYRSGYEARVMRYLDLHPDVLQWSSEELAIPYLSPIDNKVHRYFVDFVVKIKTKDGKIQTWLLEVKPKVQTAPPKVKSGKASAKYLKEVFTWGINEAKWKAAERYCTKHGYQFKLITEKEIGIDDKFF
jgi:hypothetical protein